MKLKKINEEHYVVVYETEIKEGDWMYNHEREPSLLQCIGKGSIRGWKKITHSTQPIEIIHTFGVTMTNPPMGFINIIELPLSEVKELLGEVDVEKRAKENYVEPLNKQGEKRAQLVGNGGLFGFNKFKKAFKKGYNQALNDNEEKKYTEEDIREAFEHGLDTHFMTSGIDTYEQREQYRKVRLRTFIQSLQPKKEWEVDIINGKLTLI